MTDLLQAVAKWAYDKANKPKPVDVTRAVMGSEDVVLSGEAERFADKLAKAFGTGVGFSLGGGIVPPGSTDKQQKPQADKFANACHQRGYKYYPKHRLREFYEQWSTWKPKRLRNHMGYLRQETQKEIKGRDGHFYPDKLSQLDCFKIFLKDFRQ